MGKVGPLESKFFGPCEKVYDRRVPSTGIWLNQKGIKKYREMAVSDAGYSHLMNLLALDT